MREHSGLLGYAAEDVIGKQVSLLIPSRPAGEEIGILGAHPPR